MCRVAWRTELSAKTAINVVAVVAVLSEVLGVAVVEGQAVAAHLQGWDARLARVVLVAGGFVGVETELVRTHEVPGSLESDRGLLGTCTRGEGGRGRGRESVNNETQTRHAPFRHAGGKPRRAHFS